MKKLILLTLIVMMSASALAADIFVLRRGNTLERNVDSATLIQFNTNGEMVSSWSIPLDEIRLRRFATDRYISLSADENYIVFHGFKQSRKNIPVFGTFNIAEKEIKLMQITGEELLQRAITSIDGNQFFYAGRTNFDGIRMIDADLIIPDTGFTTVTFALQQLKILNEKLWFSRGTGDLLHGLFYIPLENIFTATGFVDITPLTGQGWREQTGEYRDFDFVFEENLLFVGGTLNNGNKGIEVFEFDEIENTWDLIDELVVNTTENLIGIQAINNDGIVTLYYNTRQNINKVEYNTTIAIAEQRWTESINVVSDFLRVGENWSGIVVVK